MRGWILITGAARRIGRVMALHLARQGWDIIIHYHRSVEEAARLAQEIKAMGRQVLLAEIDLANSAAVAKLIPALANEIGHISALVNNASLFEPDHLDPDGSRHWAINAEAPRLLTRTFVDQLPANVSGNIINILDGVPAEKNFDAYNRSKIALREVTLNDARRLAPRLRVNGIEPGPVLINGRQSPPHFQTMIDATLLKQAVNPDDIAKAAAFLLDTASITGTLLPLNAGTNLLTQPSKN